MSAMSMVSLFASRQTKQRRMHASQVSTGMIVLALSWSVSYREVLVREISLGLLPGGQEKKVLICGKKSKAKKTVQKHIASVKRHLRAGGGKHEMFPVSIAMDAKRVGFTPSELRSMTLNTEDVVFHYRTYRGKHHKSTASSLFHQDLIAQLKVAKTKTEALRIIEDMHEKHVVGYKSKK